MSLGTLGSTLNDELNRLANGGTYRDSAAMVDEALAAKQWANRENISPYSTDTVGVLNEIAGLGLDKKNWLDFNGVCNYIAGTSGLPAAAALRQIYPTTDLLTGVAAYYVDAIDASASGQTITNLGNAGSLLPTTLGSSTTADSNDPIFLAHTGTNYVYLPGVVSNFLSVPDSAALDITSDIDLRWYGALDDWTPASNGRFITKYNGVDGNYSFAFGIATNGGLTLGISPNGTIASATTTTSSTVITAADGTPLWTRATWRQSDGRVQFFTSTDGTTWTQLGTNQTNASASIFASVSNIEIGSANAGTANLGAAGKHYRAQIFSDITGTTKVLDVDTSVITAGSATSFTALTGQTMTINRATSGRKTVAVTQPTWLFGTDDYMEVNNRYMAHSTAAENYVYLSGASGNYMSVADNPPLDVTGDIDIRVNVALDDWTPTTNNMLLSKYNSGSAGARSYQLMVSPSGFLTLQWSTTGSTLTNNISSTVVNTITDGTARWIRATLDIDNGAGGNDVRFFTSTDGSTWTQLGATVTTAGTTSLWSGTAQVELGSRNVGTADFAKGKFFRAQILNGINGTVVLDADASVITLPSQTTFVDRSSNAYTVTINKSGVGTFVSTGNYLYLPGIDNNLASSPDSAALDITGDLDLRVKVAMDDWTPSAASMLISKYINNTNVSYQFYLNTNGTMTLSWSPNGTIASTIYSNSIATGIADGTTKWVRGTLDVDNGAGGFSVQFFTSDDGLTWTQLGTTNTVAGVTSIFNSTSQLGIGAVGTAGSTYFPARGKFFRAQVLNGINGTVAFDANFENSITSLNQASFTESSTNGATVTINRSGSTFRSAGVIDAGYLYPGATNTFSNSTTDFLNFGATDSMSVIMAVRQWDTPISNGYWMHKGTSSNTAYWYIRNQSTNYTTQFLSVDADGTVLAANGPTTAISGTLDSKAFTLNRATALATSYRNTVAGTSVSTTTTDSISNPGTLRIGTDAVLAGFITGEIYAAAVFRSALTAAQIRQISNYFANREAYL